MILDFVAPPAFGRGDLAAALFVFYYAMLSNAGTWPVDDMQRWFRAAGLEPLGALRFRNKPRGALVSAIKAG